MPPSHADITVLGFNIVICLKQQKSDSITLIHTIPLAKQKKDRLELNLIVCIKFFPVVFFSGTSDIFATCCYQDIRVWHLPSSKELLRISVPNMTCNAIEFTKDGRSIVSGTY